jgi:hypothetical protein
MARRNFARKAALVVGLLLIGLFIFMGYEYHEWANPIGSGQVRDEAKRSGREAASFPHAPEDYFHDMDNGVTLAENEVRGRNMWILWTGGNDRFWDEMTTASLGVFDMLKIVTSHPSQKHEGRQYDRDSRWSWLGAINEPCFNKPTAPDPERFGLWLDKRRQDCPADPFEDERKYPGVAIGARGKSIGEGKTLPIGSYYGWASGIVGLRIFPNPDFDERAAKHWDPEKYYTDPSYYNDPNLVRPYRVGMSCGFCHVGPSPIHPPADPAHPQWAELNSTVGAQYLWLDRVFSYNPDLAPGDSNFLDQLLGTYKPGTFDTSLVSTDYINNPRTMNAVYHLLPRLVLSKRWGKEILKGDELANKQLQGFFDPPDTSWSPRVLKDGSDSVGVLGALNRVYINIGLFSEEWLTHFIPFFGGKPISNIPIPVAEKNSAYWQATEAGTGFMAAFLVKAGQPDPLKDAPGGTRFQTTDPAILQHGRTVFADTCARCHSSKLPVPAKGLDPAGCSGPGYLDCWKQYWAWTKTDDFKAQIRKIVLAPDFLDGNYLSADFRVPVTLLRTNACSPLATNAIADNIWSDFSSSTYKALPSVGTVTLQDPFTGEKTPYQMPAGGRGYTRVPSLVSVWSTAPLLLNNRLGPFSTDPSVEARITGFEASIEQLLWPEKRQHDTLPSGETLDGFIDRTPERSWIKVPEPYLPGALSWFIESPLNVLLPYHADADRHLALDATGHIEIGPIPKGTPINLLANLRPLAESNTFTDQVGQVRKLLGVLYTLKSDLKTAAQAEIDDGQFANLAKPLLALSKCPDFVVNRGHYFGTAKFNDTDGLSEDEKSFGPEPVLNDDDKRSLIEFLKIL